MAFVAAIVLAAGESRRMGRQKALLPWRGTTLLEYQLAQLAAIEDIREITVVTGHEPSAIGQIAQATPRVSVAHNPEYRTGKATSILAGLRALSRETEAILLLAVDQPRPATIMARLVAAHVAASALITQPVRGGRHGHPVIFARALLPELLAISDETEGIRPVMRAHAAEALEVQIDDDAIFVDLNTPADVQASSA